LAVECSRKNQWIETGDVIAAVALIAIMVEGSCCDVVVPYRIKEGA
jgi:hypothetical protein